MTGGVLRYTAAAGKVNNVTFVEAPTGTVTIERITQDSDTFGTVTGCVTSPPTPPAVNPTVVTCTGVTSAVIDAGDQSDRITAGYVDDAEVFHGLMSVTATITGGDGSDALAGGARRDIIDGGAGNDDIDGFAGNDQLSGGDGNDVLRPNTGTDTLVGGDGIDSAVYQKRVSPSFSLDGLANDGAAGENDLIGMHGAESLSDRYARLARESDRRRRRRRAPRPRPRLRGAHPARLAAADGPDLARRARDRRDAALLPRRARRPRRPRLHDAEVPDAPRGAEERLGPCLGEELVRRTRAE